MSAVILTSVPASVARKIGEGAFFYVWLCITFIFFLSPSLLFFLLTQEIYEFFQGYYKRSPEYIPTVHRKRVGCFKMPVVHSAVLIDLKMEGTNNLLYWPQPDGFTGPVDDVVQFAFSAKKEGQLEHAMDNFLAD